MKKYASDTKKAKKNKTDFAAIKNCSNTRARTCPSL